MTAAYFTLGCKLNFSETSTIGKIFEEKGIVRAEKGTEPDLLVVTGCYAQLKSEEIARLEGVEMVLGN